MTRSVLAWLLATVALGVLAASSAAAAPAWTTYRHDAARSGFDPDSGIPVTPSQAWQTPALDGEVYAQPLVYGSSVFVATENNTVYKLDAATGAVVWSQHLATPESSSAAPCGDIAPSIGITSTPVIDPATNRIYAVGAVSATGDVRHELFALDLGSGQPVGGFPVQADPPYPAGGAAVNQLQRAGLALDGGRILIGYGGNDGDCNTYWGWLVSAPETGTGGLGAFQVDPSHHEGAIWAAGNAPTVDAAGDVFVATGNGNGNASADPDFGDTVVKLNAGAMPLDWWAPTNWQSLDATDADLGSSMPMLLPSGYLFQSGKDGSGYLLDGAGLGHVSAPVGEATGFCPGGSFGGSVYYPATTTIYAACSGGLRALSLGSGSPPSLSTRTGFTAPAAAAGPPMIAGGLVWVTSYSSHTLYGLDASTGAATSTFSIPEAGAQVNHFASPSAGGGRLFVGSGDQVTAYTIAQAPAPSATITSLATSAAAVAPSAPVILTATVAPAPDGGTVTYTDGGASIAGCSGVSIASGRAVCQTAFAASGVHSVVASYSGDESFAGSASAPVTESVSSTGGPGGGSTGGTGGGPTGGGSTGGHPPPPAITRVSIAPRRFTAAHGSSLRLTLSEPATLSVAVTHLRRGHTVGHDCSRTARTGKLCFVRITLRRLQVQGRAGARSYRLVLRALAAGPYTVLVYATDRAGRRSRTVRIPLTILRPR